MEESHVNRVFFHQALDWWMQRYRIICQHPESKMVVSTPVFLRILLRLPCSGALESLGLYCIIPSNPELVFMLFLQHFQ